MKKNILIFTLISLLPILGYGQVKTINSVYTQNYELTQFITSTGNDEPSKNSYSIGCLWNNEQMVFSNVDGHYGLLLFAVKTYEGGKMDIDYQSKESWGNIHSHTLPYSASTCMYQGKLYLFAHTLIDDDHCFGYYSFTNKGYIVPDNDGKAHKINIGHTVKRSAIIYLPLCKKLMLFFIDDEEKLYSSMSTNLSNWSKPFLLDSLLLKSDNCNIAICSYLASDTTERIFIAYSTGDHTNNKRENLHFAIADTNGHFIKTFSTRFPSLCFLEVAYGSVNGGNYGNNIQIFLSSSDYYVNNTNNYKLYRTEFNVDNESFTTDSPELLNNSYYQVNSRKYKPVAFIKPYFVNQSHAQQKLILFSFDYVWGFSENWQVQWYLRGNNIIWNSNQLQLIDIHSYNSKRDKWHLIGVVEGVPPYVLNGDSLGTLITSLIFPSSIELTNGVVHSKQTTNTTSTSYEFDFGGSGYHWGKMNSETKDTTVTITTSRTFYPTLNNVGYRLFSKPKFILSHYKEYDWYGNDIQRDFYILNYDTDIFELEPFSMDTIDKAPSHLNFSKFINRNSFLDTYSKYYSSNFQWTLGSNLEQTYEISTTNIKTNESFHGSDIGLVVDLPINISAGFVASKDWSFSRTTTSTITNGVTIRLQSTHGDRTGDTMSFSGKFYWIKPTDYCDNYWIPPEFKNQNPWLMTYAITEAPIINTGLINSVLDNNSDNDIIITPNPASNYIEISLTKNNRINSNFDDADDIAIYNFLGACVKTIETSLRPTLIKIDISHLPAGVYIIKSGMLTKTFVKF